MADLIKNGIWVDYSASFLDISKTNSAVADTTMATKMTSTIFIFNIRTMITCIAHLIIRTLVERMLPKIIS